jgi:hypothetical protein
MRERPGFRGAFILPTSLVQLDGSLWSSSWRRRGASCLARFNVLAALPGCFARRRGLLGDWRRGFRLGGSGRFGGGHFRAWARQRRRSDLRRRGMRRSSGSVRRRRASAWSVDRRAVCTRRHCGDPRAWAVTVGNRRNAAGRPAIGCRHHTVVRAQRRDVQHTTAPGVDDHANLQARRIDRPQGIGGTVAHRARQRLEPHRAHDGENLIRRYACVMAGRRRLRIDCGRWIDAQGQEACAD